MNAESKLKEVTTMGYQLLANYEDLFDYTKSEHHSEYIFDIEYQSGIGEGSTFTTAFFPNFSEMNEFFNITGQDKNITIRRKIDKPVCAG